MEDKEIEQLLRKLLEKSKQDKTVLNSLKNTSVKAQIYELAATLRDIETTVFPESLEEKEAKRIGQELNAFLRMADLVVPNKECWLIFSLFKLYAKKKGKSSIKDVTDLQFKAREFFLYD